MIYVFEWVMRFAVVLLAIGLLIVGLVERRDGLVIAAAILLGARIIAAGNSG